MHGPKFETSAAAWPSFVKFVKLAVLIRLRPWWLNRSRRENFWPHALHQHNSYLVEHFIGLLVSVHLGEFVVEDFLHGRDVPMEIL